MRRLSRRSFMAWSTAAGMTVALAACHRRMARVSADAPLLRVGGQLAYVEDDDQLWLVSGDTFFRLTDHADRRVSSPRWSPDGTEIAYLAREDHPSLPESDRRADIFIVSESDESRRVAARSEPVRDLSWLPTGGKLLYSAGTPGVDGLRVTVANLDGSGVVTFRPGATSIPHVDQVWPTPSPDGSAVAFVERAYGTYMQTFLMVADLSGQSRVLVELTTVPPSVHLPPTWTPDGAAVLFRTREGGDGHDEHRLYIVDADGSSLEGSMDLADIQASFDWSP